MKPVHYRYMDLRSTINRVCSRPMWLFSGLSSQRLESIFGPRFWATVSVPAMDKFVSLGGWPLSSWTVWCCEPWRVAAV